MVTCSASLRKAWLQDPNSYLAPEQQGAKSEARHLKISPRVRIGNIKTIAFLDWIALPRKGGSGWRRRLWWNGTQAEDGDKKKTRRHHWNGSAETLAFVPVSTFRAAQWSPPPALRQEQHSEFSGTTKICIFWAKELYFQLQWQHEGFTVPTSHRSTDHLLCIEHNSPWSCFSLPACKAQNTHQLPFPLQI